MYGQTYADLGQTPSSVSWRLLRQLRATPPGGAAKGERRQTFDASLEQAEELFRAASDVGPATRPILAFYGVSQAGRAIASAALRAQQQEHVLHGHGIGVGPMHGVHKTGLAAVEVADNGNGSFTKVAKFLGSGSLPNWTSLGTLWGLLPDLLRFPLPGIGNHRSAGLAPSSTTIARSNARITARVTGLPASLARDASKAQPTEEDFRAERARLASFLNTYPSLDGWTFVFAEDSQPVAFIGGQVEIAWPVANDRSDSAEREVLDGRSTGYQSGRIILPRVAGEAKALHPLVVWWAILFALSNVSRYEPKAWAGVIDISRSRDAVAVENLLDRALVMLPELIHRSIIEVSS